MEEKLIKLKRNLKLGNFFYVANQEDIFYLTGFSGSFSRVLISKEKNFFLTDKRYSGVAEQIGIDRLYEIIVTNDYKNEIKKIIKHAKEIFISPQTLLTEYLWLKDSGYKLNINNTISDLRMIKNENEVELIKKSIEITEKGILHIFSILKNNITETELSVEFEYYIKKAGADSISFSPIIAFGKNSAIPHYKTGQEKLKENTLILIDAGVKYKNYCSDLTRIIGYRIIKTHLKKYLKYYNIVKSAKNKSVLFFKDGNSVSKSHIFVENYLKRYKLNSLFTHSLGHGIGINIHEKPYINKKDNLKFKYGMIVTCEPGIYFSGEYGIRIEDDYMITENEPVKLSKLSDELLIKH
jgi:Xaa-Pro aminopeptidase